MRINELNEANSVVAGNMIAIDTGNGTFKLDYDTLARAIMANMTEKINNEVSIVLGSNRTTWSDVYEILDKLPTYHAAVFHSDINPSKVISNNNSVIGNSSLRGVVARGATGEFRFMCMTVTGLRLFSWQITNANTATPTFGTIYEHADTQAMPTGGYIDESTWSALWTNCLIKITQSQIGFVGIFSASAASVLSNGKITSLVSATIWRGGSDSSRSFRVMAMSDTGQYQYSWKITSATSSSRTTGTVYRFTGTAL